LIYSIKSLFDRVFRWTLLSTARHWLTIYPKKLGCADGNGLRRLR